MNFTWLFVAAVYAAAIALARRAGAELPKRIALFFYLLVLLFLFRPLTQPYVNFQVDVLPSLPPWHHVTNYHHQSNSELNDVPMQIVPWMHQVRESWKSFTPPLWNHFSGSGYPLLGNGQSSALSILRVVTLPLRLGHAVTAEAALKILIALTFTFLYCLRRYSPIGSTIAAVTFGFGGFIIAWLHFPMATAACLAPAVLYAIDLLAERRTRGRFTFAAVVWTQLLFAGHPETAAHLFWLGTVYALWLVIAEEHPWRLFLALGGALAVSALLAAPYLGPLLETMPKSKRVEELKALPYSADDLPHRDLRAAMVMIQPHAFGTPKTEPLAGFAGMFGAVAWIAIILNGRWRSREMFFALTTLFIVGVIFAWPVIGDSFHLMMPIAAHARARLLFTLLCAIQIAAAVDLARRVPLLLATLAAAIVLIAIPKTDVLPMFPGIFTLLAITLFAMARHQAAAMALLVVVIGEMFAAGREVNMPLPQQTFYPKTPLIAKLQELARTSREPFRIAGIGAQFFPNLSAMYGLEDIRAHDPMSYGRYLAFLKLTAGYEPWNYFAFLPDANKPVFGFLNVRYVVVAPGAPVAGDFTVIYDGRDGKILENRSVLPRFYGVRNALPVDYARMRQHHDWANSAFADVKVHGTATTRITSAKPTEYRLRANATRPSLIVSSIPLWPGWKVMVNRRRVRPIEVNAAFLGFVVPPGQSEVRVWYAPVSFRAGVWVSLATVIALGLVRRESRPSP